MVSGRDGAGKRYSVIGISDKPRPEFSPQIKALIASHRVFAGGARQYERVQSLLPNPHRWIEISGNLGNVCATLKSIPELVAVFASGDPLFHGFAESLGSREPETEMDVYPHFHCLQTLCHRLKLPYQNLDCVSVHGRAWRGLDQALIEGREIIGALTDTDKSPAAIAQRMLAYGFTQYRMAVGECLDGESEAIRQLTLDAAGHESFQPLNCVILQRVIDKDRPFGIADHLFQQLPHRENMLTKMPFRLAALSRLNLRNAKRFWDIGFCTGSVSIEARQQFPHLHVTAFEKRMECLEILERNARNLSAPGIEAVMGDFLGQDIHARKAPDAVFIGGHGNGLDKVMASIHGVLPTGGRVVMNAVREASRSGFEHFFGSAGYEMLPPMRMTLDDHNPIQVLTAIRK
jgi:precorrin-6Y C5,15-methyltransferase (decarboxylating)